MENPVDFRLRPVVPADLGAIHQLNRRTEEQDRIPLVTPLVEFEEWLDDPHLDLGRDARLAEVGDRVVAWGRIWHRPSGAREERAYLFGSVDADYRGRGIGRALLAAQVERASEILRAAPADLPRFVRAQVYDFQESAIRLFRRGGFVPVRYNDELLRDLDPLPVAAAPAGIAIVPWDSARSEEARAAQNDAFADHWGTTPRDRATWEHDLASFGTRLDLSFLALDGPRVVAVCRNASFPGDEALTGRRDGWIFQVSVVRSHRKRGIASALIAASLAAFKAAGLTHGALGVDSENPTGAYRLYERLSFRRMHRSVVHQLTL
jgi:ribosomal protein S18 acetylase RimI-like enzyme